MHHHIAIAGNIGVGKTTLTQLIAKHYKWKPHFEEVENNPYLDDFYHDMKKWSFNLQVYFLGQRFEQIKAIKDGQKTVIQDRTIYEDAFIFATNLHDMGLLESRDFENYMTMFNLMDSIITAPDLLIYLKADISTLVGRIQKRGREYESTINIDYLDRLNRKYDKWIQNYDKGKLLVIDVNELDFIENKNDLGHIINLVEAEINGLF